MARTRRSYVKSGRRFHVKVGDTRTIVRIVGLAKNYGFPLSNGWYAINCRSGRFVHIRDIKQLGAMLKDDDT